MAFSHRSTAGPSTKCCDSITSAIAASTSALIERYCALRSSNGTCMCRVPFELSVGFRADAERRRQRHVVVEVEAPEDARLDFLVAVAALRAPHDAVDVRRAEAMTVAAHPPDLVRGVADDEREVGDVFRDDRSGADERVAADRDAADDRR